MNAAILIASRELRDKYRVFITAAALALVPFIASILPFVRVKGSPDLIAVLGGMLAFSMCAGTAAVLGTTTIGRELSDGRLSFYFSKPIPPAAIWIGKAAAALIASIACWAIIAIPAILYAGDAWSSVWTGGVDFIGGLAVVCAIAIFFTLHIGSTMSRSRSALLAVDFVLAGIAAACVSMILRPLVWAMATELIGGVVSAMTAGLLIVIAVAPIWQLANGRTDRKRSHAALSKALWPGVAIVLLLAAGFVGWIVSASPRDLQRNIEVAQAPASGWTVASGGARNRFGYRASFLIDREGRHYRVPPTWWGADISRDGKTAAWLQPVKAFRRREMELYTLDLTRPGGDPVATGIRFTFGEFALSEDGKRIAISDQQNLAVHDLAAKRLLFSGRISGPGRTSDFFFVTPDLVRMIERPLKKLATEKATPVIREIDLRTKTVTTTGTVEPVDGMYPVASLDGSRIIFRREGLLVDGRTGATIARYGKIGGGPTFLRDGTLITTTELGVPTRVTIHKPDATPITVALPGVNHATVRGEIAPGKIAIQAGASRVQDYPTLGKVFIVDTATGNIDRVENDLRGPLVAWNNVDPRPLPIDSGQPLVAYDNKTLKYVRWNPITGERKPLGIGQ